MGIEIIIAMALAYTIIIQALRSRFNTHKEMVKAQKEMMELNKEYLKYAEKNPKKADEIAEKQKKMLKKIYSQIGKQMVMLVVILGIFYSSMEIISLGVSKDFSFELPFSIPIINVKVLDARGTFILFILLSSLIIIPILRKTGLVRT